MNDFPAGTMRLPKYRAQDLAQKKMAWILEKRKEASLLVEKLKAEHVCEFRRKWYARLFYRNLTDHQLFRCYSAGTMDYYDHTSNEYQSAVDSAEYFCEKEFRICKRLYELASERGSYDGWIYVTDEAYQCLKIKKN